jgi:hypothetical protein
MNTFCPPGNLRLVLYRFPGGETEAVFEAA